MRNSMVSGSTVILENTIVHESADERQFVRVQIPAQFKIISLESDEWCSVQEMSLGGFSSLLSDNFDYLEVGFAANAIFQFDIGAFKTQIEVPFCVVKNNGERLSAKFGAIDQNKREVLRYIISTFLSGELVSVNSLVNVSQRENHTVQRKNGKLEPRRSSERLKAILGTSLCAVGAICVFGVLVLKVFDFVFVENSVFAAVKAKGYSVKMPANGHLSLLIKNDVSSVKVGDPLAMVSTSLMSNISSMDSVLSMDFNNRKNLRDIVNEMSVETMINSPCNCRVIWKSPDGDRFSYKGDEIFYLIPNDTSLYIEASYDFYQLKTFDLSNTPNVNFTFESKKYQGRVVSWSLDENENRIKLNVATDENLPVSALNTPVYVRLFRDLPFGFL